MNLLMEQQTLTNHWQTLQPILFIETEDDYERALDLVEQLMNAVRHNTTHPLYSLFCTLVRLIEVYEADHHSIPDGQGVDALAHLIEEHNLQASELPEIGSEKLVAEILDGSRSLTVNQIQSLAQRFHVAPAVFLDAAQ